MKKIIIINGPNLNLLGQREPDIYGSQTFEDYFAQLVKMFEGKADLDYYQSNHEGALIDKIQSVGFDFDGIVLNGGALTHYSHALADAVSAINTPVVEVHISNIHAREKFRHETLSGARAVGCIAGLGLSGYRYAIDYFLQL